MAGLKTRRGHSSMAVYAIFGSPFLGALSQGIGFGLGYGMGVNVGYNAASRVTEPKSTYKPYRSYYARQDYVVGSRNYSSPYY